MKKLKIYNVIDLELSDSLADEVIRNVKESHGEISYIEFVLKSLVPSVVEKNFRVKGNDYIDGVGQIKKVDVINDIQTVWRKEDEYDEDEYEF